MQKHALKNALTFLLVVFILTANSFADNWQQWRGTHNDGISTETEAPIQWSQTENVKWRFAAPR